MSKQKIDLPFNKDCMSVRDLKTIAGAFQQVLRDFDNFSDEPEEFVLRVLQIRHFYNPNA